MIKTLSLKHLFYFLTGLFLVLIVTDHWSHGRAAAFSFANDAAAQSFVQSNCNPGGAKRTVHIAYATNVTNSGADVSFDLHAFSYNCGTTKAPNVSNTLTVFSPAGVAVPHVFYSGLMVPINTFTPVASYGPFTYTNLSTGNHTFSYSYAVTSYTDSAVGNASFTVTIPVNNPPSGSISAVCDANGSLSIKTTTTDPENDSLTVSIKLPDGTTYSGSGPGTHDFGLHPSAQDGVAKKVTGTVKDTRNGAQNLSGGGFTCAPPEHDPSGSITAADCSSLSGTFSDEDHAGPYRIDIHFKDGPPTYTNTYTVSTDGNNKFSLAIPAAYRKYNGGATTNVWIDGLGKTTSGANSTWVSLNGSPKTFGPCLDAGCNLVEYDLGGGYTNLGNNGSLTAVAGQTLHVKVAWKNTAAAGGVTWTKLGSGTNNAFDAGWDTSAGGSGGYNPATNGRLRAESKGSSTGLGQSATFYWDPGTLITTGVHNQVFRMVYENPNGEWFGGSCSFTLKVKYAPITGGTIVECNLGASAGFVDVGDPFDASYSAEYTPTGDPLAYPTIHVTNTSFKITPGIPARAGTPNDFSLAPSATGTNKTVAFTPPQYVINTPGIYSLDGSFDVSAPDGIGGTTTFTVSCHGTKTVGTRPYMRVYGGEVVAGISYKADCTAAPATIAGSARSNGAGDWVGAGSQFAAATDGTIISFATANLFQPNAPSTLAFANTPASTLPTIGGNFGNRVCAPEYWPVTLPALGSSPLNATTSGRFQLPGGSTLTQVVGQPLAHNTVIYVDGDLTIGSDLITTTTWSSPDEIPTLYVIVKGSIYIKPGVHEIDALLVAQPTASTPTVTSGRIFTCYNNSDSDTDSLWIATNCNEKLTVYGAMIAAKVNFLRVKGQLGTATAQEAASSGNIAETIQFSPELLLNTPALTPHSSSNNLNSIVGLSPSL